MRYEILNSRLENVKKLVNKITKKGGLVVFEVGKSYLKEFKFLGELGEKYSITEEVTEVELEATFKIEGFTPIAVVDHIAVEGGSTHSNIVTPFLNTITIPKKYYTDHGHCDHCNTDRQRNKTILIEKDGEIRQVGLSCLKDYTGIDASNLAMISQYIREIEQYEGGLNYSSADYVNVLDYVASCVHAYHKSGDVYKKTTNIYGEYNPDSTKDKGFEVYYKKMFTDLDKEQAEAILTYLKEQPEDYDNDYLTNLKTLVTCEYSKVNYAGLLASLVSFKENQERRLEQQLSRDAKKLSKFQHSVGDKIEVKLTLRFIADYGTEWGSVSIYELTDTNHNVYIWKTSNFFKDGIYLVKGTVKEHTLFNEIEQTILTRCKLTQEEVK